MKSTTIIKKVESQTDWDTFLNYIEDCLKKGMTNGKIAENSPVKFSSGVMAQILDIWYPGYSTLSTPERRKWILEQWPIHHLELKHTWRKEMYNESHPVYKYFTKFYIQAFNGQKHSAKLRNIEWQFDFMTWLIWWIKTGHLDERGVTDSGYQMCRINDTGPYSWENVYCDTGKNNRESFWTQIYPKTLA